MVYLNMATNLRHHNHTNIYYKIYGVGGVGGSGPGPDDLIKHPF